MKSPGNYTIPVILITSFSSIMFSCNNNKASDIEKKAKADSANSNNTTKVVCKIPCTYQDTLTVSMPAAVFYHPDSLQLEKIKQHTNSTEYNGSMHEYFYMMRNARIIIQKAWPGLKIIEAKNYRYLLFIRKDGSGECIDLDIYDDFLFDGKKSPQLVDVPNIDTELYFYFKD